MKIAHTVPLSPQAVDVIAEARRRFGNAAFVFPFDHRRPLSQNAIRAWIIRAGYEGKHCAHGWRSTFSTNMKARDLNSDRLVEIALAHYACDVASRYDRGIYLDQRRVLMCQWADLLLADMPTASEIAAIASRATPTMLAPRLAA